MSQKKQHSSPGRGSEKQQKYGFSGGADHRELLGWVDRELDQLFKEFLESPWRARPRNLTQKAPVRSGCDTAVSGSNATDDCSAE